MTATTISEGKIYQIADQLIGTTKELNPVATRYGVHPGGLTKPLRDVGRVARCVVCKRWHRPAEMRDDFCIHCFESENPNDS